MWAGWWGYGVGHRPGEVGGRPRTDLECRVRSGLGRGFGVRYALGR
jgi:hypothetical protein